MGIFLRGKIWYCNLYVNGRRIRKPLDSNRRFAETKYLQLRQDRDAGKFHRQPVGAAWLDFRNNYLAWSKNTKKPTTHALELRAIKDLEEFHHINKIEDVTPGVLEKLRAYQKEQGCGAAKINRGIRALKVVMRHAEDQNLVAPPPGRGWRSVGSFKEAQARTIFYSTADLARVFKKAKEVGEHHLVLAMLASRAGLRVSECFYLRWEDVSNDQIHICAHDNWTPKTYEDRYIPQADDLKRLLDHLRPGAKTPFVIAQGSWRPASPEAMGTEFKGSVLMPLRLPGRVHVLRHTFASHLAQAGEPLYNISKLLGHNNIKTTERHYAHLCPATFRNTIKRLPKIPIK